MKSKFLFIFLFLTLYLVACNAPAATPNLIPETEKLETPAPVEINAPLIESPSLIKIHFLNERDGWGITETQIVRTNDGGITWYSVTPPDVTETGYSVDWFVLDNDHVWIQQPDFANYPFGGFQFATTDGGINWKKIAVPFSDAHVSFLDANNGWAMADLGVGAGSNAVAVYQTTDGGATWIQKFINDPNHANASESLPLGGLKYGLAPLNMQTAWIYGVVYAPGTPYLFRTDDGGATWSSVMLPLPAGGENAELSVEQISFANGNAIFLVMRNTSDAINTPIYLSTDSGSAWLLTPTSIPGSGEVSFISADELVVYNREQFYITRDAANTWSIIPPDIKFGDSFSTMDFVSATTGYVVSQDPTTNHRSLYRTDDGGATWFPVIP
ncbi:MAG TPA: hypothetical protein PKK96_00050 [Anaerolineales bacterium]|nr:hypothetical protein [Anaerolineales bacterium]HNS59365.1 hypothetical protein [Anaerolineales bacterium]